MEVRAMFDAFGNWSNNQPLKKHHLQAIKARGIEIVKFDPITFPYINHAMHRDHRKIVVIDGKTGYTGGMNIADYYINGLPKNRQMARYTHAYRRDAVRYSARHLPDYVEPGDRTTHRRSGILPQPAPISGQHSRRDFNSGPHPRETPRSISHAYAVSIEAAQKTSR